MKRFLLMFILLLGVFCFGSEYVVTSYAFNKTAKTVTFSSLGSVNIEEISSITNLTQGKKIFQSGDPSLGGSVSGNVLTLRFNTNDSLFSNSDKLEITLKSKGATESSLSSIDTKTPALGQATMALSQPVAIASNQSSIPVTGTFWQPTQPVSLASVPLPSGASTSALQTTANSSLSSIALSGFRSNAGTDTASGNTHTTIGGTDGTNLRPLLTDDLGRAVVKRGSRFQFRNTVTLTGTTETTLIASVASIRHCIQFLIICNNSTTDRVTLSLRDSTGGTVIPLGGFEPNASGKMPAIPFHFPVALEQTTANNNWTIQATGTSPNVTVVAVSERVN